MKKAWNEYKNPATRPALPQEGSSFCVDVQEAVVIDDADRARYAHSQSDAATAGASKAKARSGTFAAFKEDDEEEGEVKDAGAGMFDETHDEKLPRRKSDITISTMMAQQFTLSSCSPASTATPSWTPRRAETRTSIDHTKGS